MGPPGAAADGRRWHRHGFIDEMQSDDRPGISISMFGMLISDPPAADVGGRSGGGQFRQQIFIVSLMVRAARAAPRGLAPAILRYKLRA